MILDVIIFFLQNLYFLSLLDMLEGCELRFWLWMAFFVIISVFKSFAWKYEICIVILVFIHVIISLHVHACFSILAWKNIQLLFLV